MNKIKKSLPTIRQEFNGSFTVHASYLGKGVSHKLCSLWEHRRTYLHQQTHFYIKAFCITYRIVSHKDFQTVYTAVAPSLPFKATRKIIKAEKGGNKPRSNNFFNLVMPFFISLIVEETIEHIYFDLQLLSTSKGFLII